jgi:hypothetical protein
MKQPMRYRLGARLSHPDGCDEFLSAAIPTSLRGGYPDRWEYASNELSTPAGLPIVFRVFFDKTGRIELIVAGKSMLDVSGVEDLTFFYFDLTLPTDERLVVSVSDDESHRRINGDDP